MTAEELIFAVDAHLTKHLDAAFWAGLDADRRTAAVAMAEFDIFAELPGATLENTTTDSFTCKAIAEQAVFLARNYENINEGKVVTSENVGGVSQGYTLIGYRPGLSFRAVAFIQRARQSVSGGLMHVRRG